MKRNVHPYHTCDAEIFQTIAPSLPDKHLVSEACWRDGESKAMLTQRCPRSDATHSITLLWSHQFKCLQPNKDTWISLKGQQPQRRSLTDRILCCIHICIRMCPCTPMYVSAGDTVRDAVPLAGSWQVVAVRVWLLLPGERKPPAFSAGLTFTEDYPWKRLGSIRVVNLIISESLNHVMIEQVLQKRFSFS